MGARFRSWWPKIKHHLFITTGIIVVLCVLIAFTIALNKFGWDWTGFRGGESKITTTMITPGTTTATPGTTVATEQLPAKTLWDWLGLLAVLAIPVVVGLGAAWYTAQQGKVSDRENTDNQRETALQKYIDKMSELLLEKHFRNSQPADEARTIARVRTITVLTQLDARRIGYVFAFLREAELMSTTSNDSIVSLKNANLEKINFSQARIEQGDLREADLSGANLYRANLSKTDLSGANLSEANLSGAWLMAANVTTEQLDKAKSLKGAIMPDGPGR